MIEASLIKGVDGADTIQTQLKNAYVKYIHNAAPGCFSCSIERVDNK